MTDRKLGVRAHAFIVLVMAVSDVYVRHVRMPMLMRPQWLIELSSLF